MGFLIGFAIGVAVTYYRVWIWGKMQDVYYMIGGK